MRGVTADGLRRCAQRRCISTRTPHAGSDVVSSMPVSLDVRFQPALPMRGVTSGEARDDVKDLISTRTPHAGSDLQARDETGLELISTRTPHAGSDRWPARSCSSWPYFNPHSPCGE